MKSTARIFFFLAISLCFHSREGYCQLLVNRHKIFLTDATLGKTITVHIGTTVILKLANQPDGGYIPDSIKYNEVILRLVKHVQMSPAANSRLGQPGKALWEFTALRTGSSLIKVTASRPWNKIDFITIYSSILKIKR